MTKEQTIKVLELLNAFYAGGKGDPQQQVIAWHLILGKYDFEDAMIAVLKFAERGRREYASMPAVGRIVEAIEERIRLREAPIREILQNIQNGLPWPTLTKAAKDLIPEASYEKWLAIDAEEFANTTDKYAAFLRKRMTEITQSDHMLEEPQKE